jgi:tryptophan-rich sensory protein
MNAKLIKYSLIFLVLNFAALAIGGMATSEAVTGEWYTGINKAPWTPPGCVFGAAWSTIMLCFAFFMGFALRDAADKKRLLSLFAIQWLLNVSWNPIFFVYHYALFGLMVIVCLTVLVGYFLFSYWSVLRAKALLIAPYFVWLLIATSLNVYIVIYN